MVFEGPTLNSLLILFACNATDLIIFRRLQNPSLHVLHKVLGLPKNKTTTENIHGRGMMPAMTQAVFSCS